MSDSARAQNLAPTGPNRGPAAPAPKGPAHKGNYRGNNAAQAAAPKPPNAYHHLTVIGKRLVQGIENGNFDRFVTTLAKAAFTPLGVSPDAPPAMIARTVSNSVRPVCDTRCEVLHTAVAAAMSEPSSARLADAVVVRDIGDERKYESRLSDALEYFGYSGFIKCRGCGQNARVGPNNRYFINTTATCNKDCHNAVLPEQGDSDKADQRMFRESGITYDCLIQILEQMGGSGAAFTPEAFEAFDYPKQATALLVHAACVSYSQLLANNSAITPIAALGSRIVVDHTKLAREPGHRDSEQFGKDVNRLTAVFAARPQFKVAVQKAMEESCARRAYATDNLETKAKAKAAAAQFRATGVTLGNFQGVSPLVALAAAPHTGTVCKILHKCPSLITKYDSCTRAKAPLMVQAESAYLKDRPTERPKEQGVQYVEKLAGRIEYTMTTCGTFGLGAQGVEFARENIPKEFRAAFEDASLSVQVAAVMATGMVMTLAADPQKASAAVGAIAELLSGFADRADCAGFAETADAISRTWDETSVFECKAACARCTHATGCERGLACPRFKPACVCMKAACGRQVLHFPREGGVVKAYTADLVTACNAAIDDVVSWYDAFAKERMSKGAAAKGVAPTVSAEAVSAEAVSAPAVSAEAESAPAVCAEAESAPAESAPAESVPAESVPAESVSTESVSAESASAAKRTEEEKALRAATKQDIIEHIERSLVVINAEHRALDDQAASIDIKRSALNNRVDGFYREKVDYFNRLADGGMVECVTKAIETLFNGSRVYNIVIAMRYGLSPRNAIKVLAMERSEDISPLRLTSHGVELCSRPMLEEAEVAACVVETSLACCYGGSPTEHSPSEQVVKALQYALSCGGFEIWASVVDLLVRAGPYIGRVEAEKVWARDGSPEGDFETWASKMSNEFGVDMIRPIVEAPIPQGANVAREAFERLLIDRPMITAEQVRDEGLQGLVSFALRASPYYRLPVAPAPPACVSVETQTAPPACVSVETQTAPLACVSVETQTAPVEDTRQASFPETANPVEMSTAEKHHVPAMSWAKKAAPAVQAPAKAAQAPAKAAQEVRDPAGHKHRGARGGKKVQAAKAARAAREAEKLARFAGRNADPEPKFESCRLTNGTERLRPVVVHISGPIPDTASEAEFPTLGPKAPAAQHPGREGSSDRY